MASNKQSIFPNVPFFCDLILGHQCFFRCQMCTQWKTPANFPSLSFENCKKFIDGIAEISAYMDINIMGGEPFLYDWLLPLCDYIAEKGFNAIVSTNAYLIDEPMAKKIADSRLKVLAISLDALTPSIHDHIRGMGGSHQRAIDALEFLKKYRKNDLQIVILPLILHRNLEELPSLVRWVKETDAADAVSFLALVESGIVHPKEGWFRSTAYKELWPQNPERTLAIIDELIRMKKTGSPITNPLTQLEAFKEYYSNPEKFLAETEYCIRDHIIDLDPSGEIFLSGHRLGSIKGPASIKSLWDSDRANEIREYIRVNGCDTSRACLINFLCVFNGPGKFEADTLSQRGCKYQEEGQFDLALAEFQKAAELNPEDANIRIGLAYNYFKTGAHEEALKTYNEAFHLSLELRNDENMRQYDHIQDLLKKNLRPFSG